MNKDVAKLIGALTLVSLVAGAFAFYGTLHEDYITEDKLEIILLQRDNDRLTEEDEEEEP